MFSSPPKAFRIQREPKKSPAAAERVQMFQNLNDSWFEGKIFWRGRVGKTLVSCGDMSLHVHVSDGKSTFLIDHRLSVPETLTADSHKNKSKWEIPFVLFGYIAQNRSVCDAQKTQTPSSSTWSTAPKSPWSALIIFWLPQIFTSPLSTRLSSDFPPPLFE